jgi:hypothetical protein
MRQIMTHDVTSESNLFRTHKPNAHPSAPNSIPSKLKAPTAISSPLPRRLRAWTPRQAALIPAALAQPLLGRQRELAVELVAGLLAVDEVAEAAAHAAVARVEAAAGLPEVRHGRQLAVYGPPRVPARVERVAGLLRRVLVFEARVDIADQIWCLLVCALMGIRGDSRSLLLSHTTTSSTSPYLHISHQKSS